jgi:hypothetical protein
MKRSEQREALEIVRDLLSEPIDDCEFGFCKCCYGYECDDVDESAWHEAPPVTIAEAWS